MNIFQGLGEYNILDSPFLEKTKLLENEFGFVVYDGFPVSKGHCLVVPHRVYSNYFDSTEDEIIGLQKLVVETKKKFGSRVPTRWIQCWY